MFDDEGHVAQPDFYRLTMAARALGMSGPDLNNMDEPDRTQWYMWGLTINNAEAEAANINHRASAG